MARCICITARIRANLQRQILHGTDDVDDRVERADLVQVHALERRLMDRGFGPGQTVKQLFCTVATRCRKSRLIDQREDLWQRPMALMVLMVLEVLTVLRVLDVLVVLVIVCVRVSVPMVVCVSVLLAVRMLVLMHVIGVFVDRKFRRRDAGRHETICADRIGRESGDPEAASWPRRMRARR